MRGGLVHRSHQSHRPRAFTPLPLPPQPPQSSCNFSMQPSISRSPTFNETWISGGFGQTEPSAI